MPRRDCLKTGRRGPEFLLEEILEEFVLREAPYTVQIKDFILKVFSDGGEQLSLNRQERSALFVKILFLNGCQGLSQFQIL